MEKIGFVILHYYTQIDTISCVESIQTKMKKENYEIVIIDNGSKNESGKLLKDQYEHEEKIHVLIQKENLGFAKGNNIGFKYAKEQLKCNYIVLLNNDTCILQEEFFDLIKEEYNKSGFAVLGPKIYLLKNQINPVNLNSLSIQRIKKEIRSDSLNLFFSYMGLYQLYTNTKKWIKKLLKKNIVQNLADVNTYYKNIILHGCCLIFSPIYIEKFNGLDERTFLYHEEELLFYRLQKNKMISVYNPKIEIFHAEDSATNAITVTDRKKRIFVYKNKIKSGKILYYELKRGQ